MIARAATLCLGVLLAALPARAEEFVADLSEHLIAITAGFTGARVVLFGAKEGEGDVVIVVRGPDSEAIVRRKDRVAGIWVNAASARFARVPSYYLLGSNRPLESFLTNTVRGVNQIGTDHLELREAGRKELAPDAAFREALVRLKGDQGLYPDGVVPVSFLGSSLFRAELNFPSNVPLGNYTVQVYLIRDGLVAQAFQTPLRISKAGVEAEFYRFAHRHSALYGVIAIAIALAAGWLGHMLFRR